MIVLVIEAELSVLVVSFAVAVSKAFAAVTADKNAIRSVVSAKEIIEEISIVAE